MNDNIIKLVEKLKAEIDNRGIDAVREFFSNQRMIANNLADSQDIEYIKRMIMAQLHVHSMVVSHKYHELNFEDKEKLAEDVSRLHSKIDSNNILLFDNEELDMLFGNPLGIKNQREYNKLNNYYYNMYSYDTFLKMCDLEKDRMALSSCKNPFKRFLLSQRIKKNGNHYSLTPLEAQVVRKIVSEEISKNPLADQFLIFKMVSQRMDRSLYEAGRSFEATDIIKMTLSSLRNPLKEPINIIDACKSYRRELGEVYSLMDEKIDYRKKETYLGGGIGQKKIKNIEPEKIPEEMEKLQLEYMDAYENSKDMEEYIKRVSRIFAKFVYLQPFEDCNKRTGICLLNAMFQSKGIKPVPFSVTHSKYLRYEVFKNAYDRAGQGNYSALEDVMVEVCKKEGRIAQNKENEGTKSIEKQKPNDKDLENKAEIE